MKIFYINVIEQNKGWGAETFVNRGFNENNNETILLDFRNNRYNLTDKFLEHSEDFDALFLQRGDYFPIPLLESVKRPKFFWASELVSRCRDQDRLLTTNLFDHIFVHTEECKRTIIKNGWQPEEKVSVLLNGFDEKCHRKLPDVKKDIDVLFVGNVLPRRREWLDKIGRHCNLVECKAFNEEMIHLFNRSKVLINIHAEEFLDTETRVFEALGCGSFLISETLSEDNPFSPDKHYVEIKDADEMIKKIKYYLENEEERESIASQGHSEALEKHTYTKRAEEIANLFSKHLLTDERKSEEVIDKEKVKSYITEEKRLKAKHDKKLALSKFKKSLLAPFSILMGKG